MSRRRGVSVRTVPTAACGRIGVGAIGAGAMGGAGAGAIGAARIGDDGPPATEATDVTGTWSLRVPCLDTMCVARALCVLQERSQMRQRCGILPRCCGLEEN